MLSTASLNCFKVFSFSFNLVISVIICRVPPSGNLDVETNSTPPSFIKVSKDSCPLRLSNFLILSSMNFFAVMPSGGFTSPFLMHV